MGRLSAKSPRRRGILGRPLLLFAVLLLGPAAGFCVLGWKSVVREHEFRRREMYRHAEDVLQRELRTAGVAIENIERVETARDYYEYQRTFMPSGQVSQQLGFQRSKLNEEPSNPMIRFWFSWELLETGPARRPEILPETEDRQRDPFAKTFGTELAEWLARAPRHADLRTARGRRARYTQRVVAANEERGALQEELDLQREGTPEAELPYLSNFESRVRDARIDVHYTRFRYLARGRGPLQARAGSPPLVAWRMVWIPAQQKRYREVKRDRYLIQGYALDPGRLFPTEWTSQESTLIVRADHIGNTNGQGVYVGSVVDHLDAPTQTVGESALRHASYDPSLELAVRVDLDLMERRRVAARNRFLFLVAGLLFVVFVGFFVLVRSVRREVVLARRKEDFIAAITHELKTPLTGIRMYADMLREGWVQSPEMADGYAVRILEETDRLGHLVDQVLDLAALERGVAKLNAQVGDLGAHVRDAVALLQSKADKAGVQLETVVEDGVPDFAFDPKLVRPMVLNLVDNAIKYSGKSEHKHVRVGVRQEGERVILSVADRGIGIDPKARKAVFEPFQRAGDELTREAPGVGIGLALVKRYAEAHNARVHLASEPGRGTTVEVRFRP